MKRDDPKVLKARAERDRTSFRVEVILKGLAEAIKNGYWGDLEEIQPIIEVVNVDLVDAIKAHERAVEAWRKVSPRRRVSIVRGRRRIA
jgi:uncharacterized protein YdeI (YjbR/CyaY-like superfamily)